MAFPAGSGPTDRTTYMFTYVDPKFGGPKLEELLELFWDLMPSYQDVSLEDLDIRRVIYGIFPTFRDRYSLGPSLMLFRWQKNICQSTPCQLHLTVSYRHVISLIGCPIDSAVPFSITDVFELQVGDASGIQSPVSFGGFGSLTRHLGRLSNGIHEAVEGNFLDFHSLRLLNPYMNLGDSVLQPFLQDVIQFGPLVKTLGLIMLNRPQILPSIFKQVGLGVILDWSGHFLMLGYYTFLCTFIDPVMRSWVESLPPRDKFKWKRYLEAWRYGAGLDYRQGE
ncbi:hypothetical protein PR202_gb03170 [Eleusine coracana subsp. coracana]|uniref:Uncharacterized protein n=1 Tax=Eleusine coracana subsp. coracana TaxID=191504 RepID=A0AAV5E0G1_ELECO|nr:hypothetical protein PR202_gb03170 [Eleusine coracana subsp. coracana]